MTHLSPTHIFKQNCDDMITSFYSSDIVKANKMISLTVNIAKRYPFVFLPDFVEDFMNGMLTRLMIKKYQMYNYNDFTGVATTLNLKGNRSKDPNQNNKTINLQNKKWSKQYEFLIEQSRIFTQPLGELLNDNILNALVSNTILDLEYIGSSDLKKNILNSYKKYKKNIPTLHNDKLHNSFEKYLSDDLDYKLNNSINYLTDKLYITSMDGDISLPTKYSKIHDSIYNILNDMQDGLSYNSLMVKSMNEFPLIRITSRINIINDILDKFEKEHRIIRSHAYWKYSPDSDQIFTLENYNHKMENIKRDMLSRGRTKFFGRHITPDQFIDELNMLDLGNLDDLDDQVTRIAGLVLSDAVLLQSPREDMKEFDFIVDIANYNFRVDQEDMMKKLDFQATSNIFHCKVMINDKITKNTLAYLKRVIPTGDQAVIFTCMPVSPEILQQTKDDRTIQIMDEESIRSWCSITPTIPCRRHSIAKVMYGDGRGKIVLVNSLNYESGLAVVETIPDHTETTFYIGCLQEIDLCVSNPEDFELASNTYFDFLCLLGELSFEPLEVCLDVKIHSTHDTRTSFMRKTNPELSDMYLPISGEKKSLKYIELDGVHTRVNMSRTTSEVFVQCECYHKLNEEHHHTLCKHMVASINYLCLDDYTWEGINRKINLVKKKLVKFQEENMMRVIDALYQMSDPESKLLLKSYLQKHVDND